MEQAVDTTYFAILINLDSPGEITIVRKGVGVAFQVVPTKAGVVVEATKGELGVVSPNEQGNAVTGYVREKT